MLLLLYKSCSQTELMTVLGRLVGLFDWLDTYEDSCGDSSHSSANHLQLILTIFTSRHQYVNLTFYRHLAEVDDL